MPAQCILVTVFWAIHAFNMKLVNFSASNYKFLLQKIDKLDDMLRKKMEMNLIEKEIKYFVKDHVDALE